MAGGRHFRFKDLDVYQESLDHFLWTVEVTASIQWRYRRLVDQAVGSSLSTLGNVGEASGRRLKPAEAAQHYRYAQGSAHESAAYLDALAGVVEMDAEVYAHREQQLARIGAMLSRLIDHQHRRILSSTHPQK
jgi:four helix bundle protein